VFVMFKELISTHRHNGLLIDTNLLLLLVVGLYDRRRIENFKRTSAYTLSDFQRIGWLHEQFSKLWTTPNILTEVDNLGRQLPRNEWQGFSASLRNLGLKMTERSLESSSAMARKSFSRLGLADNVTLALGESFLLISDDLAICVEASKLGYAAINFNHLRQFS
jgi:hypothetical protein